MQDLQSAASGGVEVDFNAARWQPTVDLAWFIALTGWLIAWWRPDTPSAPRLSQPYWFYALYIALLLPFATNWRWAFAGDSLGWAHGGYVLAKFGPTRSIFSTSGVHQFGYFQEQLHNIFMLLIAPTLFWHRVGQITVGALAMAAIYTVYARLVAPRFGLLVAACAMSVSVMITHTYCSYPLIDGIACGNAILAVGLWIRRDPDSRRAWLVFGFLCGFMLFLTPTAWFMALCVAAWLGPLVLWRRWPLTHPAIAAGMALIAASPILLQWGQGQGGQLFSLVEDARWSSAHLLHLLQQTVTIPFSSDMQIAGAFGAQLPPVFRWLFIPGILLTPLFSRRMFPGARLIFCFYTVHVLILTVTQGPYLDVSVKRALVLIPMATFFVFLPFHRYLRSLVVVLALIALWASFGAYNMVYELRPGRTGYNFYDGVVEAHQRLHASTVCVVVNNAERAQTIAKGSEIDVLYHTTPHLQPVLNPANPACRDALCYYPQQVSVDLQAAGYREVQLYNTVELRCGVRPTGEAAAAEH